MIILSRRAVAALVLTYLAIRVSGTARFRSGHIFATIMTFVMVLRVVCTFFNVVFVVVVVRRPILRVLAALRVGMFALWPMNVAGRFSGAFGGRLAFASTGVLVRRAIIAVVATIAIILVVALATMPSTIGSSARSAMLKITEFALVALLQIMAQLAFRGSPDLLVALLLKRAVE